MNNRKYFLILICILMLGKAYGSEPKAEVKHIKGIIIHEYLRNNSYYCSMNSYIVYDNDTLPFIHYAFSNAKFLKENPELQKIAGDGQTYIDQHNDAFPKPDYTINLDYSPYNYHAQDLGVTLAVRSITFYEKKGKDNYLYSVYQFEGSIVVYYNIDLSEPETHEEEEWRYCPKPVTNYKNAFAVLKETKKLEPLSNEHEKEMGLIKSGVIAISVVRDE